MTANLREANDAIEKIERFLAASDGFKRAEQDVKDACLRLEDADKRCAETINEMLSLVGEAKATRAFIVRGHVLLVDGGAVRMIPIELDARTRIET